MQSDAVLETDVVPDRKSKFQGQENTKQSVLVLVIETALKKALYLNEPLLFAHRNCTQKWHLYSIKMMQVNK